MRKWVCEYGYEGEGECGCEGTLRMILHVNSKYNYAVHTSVYYFACTCVNKSILYTCRAYTRVNKCV